MEKELCYMPALEMREAIRQQDVSCTEIMDTILDRIEKINPKINAYCTVSTEDAQRAAKEADLCARAKQKGELCIVSFQAKIVLFQKDFRF